MYLVHLPCDCIGAQPGVFALSLRRQSKGLSLPSPQCPCVESPPSVTFILTASNDPICSKKGRRGDLECGSHCVPKPHLDVNTGNQLPASIIQGESDCRLQTLWHGIYSFCQQSSSVTLAAGISPARHHGPAVMTRTITSRASLHPVEAFLFKPLTLICIRMGSMVPICRRGRLGHSPWKTPC